MLWCEFCIGFIVSNEDYPLMSLSEARRGMVESGVFISFNPPRGRPFGGSGVHHKLEYCRSPPSYLKHIRSPFMVKGL